jgi:hypothetical protein
MATGLKALRDHGIDAALFEPNGFRHGGRRTDDTAAGGFDPPEKICCRKTEMKTDNLRLELLDRVAECRVERRPVAGRHRS